MHWVDRPGRQRGRKFEPDGRTLPCLGKEYPRCAAHDPQRWKGYVPALLWERDLKTDQGSGGIWKVIIAEITEAARDDIIKALGEKLLWRGLVVSLKRGGRTQHQVIAEVFEKPAKDPLPPSFDVKPTLLQMWAVRERVVPQEDPPPAKDQPDPAEEPAIIPFKDPKWSKKA